MRIKRAPGESLIKDLYSEFSFYIGYWMGGTMLIVLVLIWQWVAHALNAPRSPLYSTLVGITIVVFGGFATWMHIRKLQDKAKGAHGERAVGSILDDLHILGYHTVHDLELQANGATFNADHVLVGPGGVFVIETKYVTKPPRGRPEIRAENDQIYINGAEARGNAIGQVIAISNELAARLYEHTGLRLKIIPVVAYPGWYVTQARNCNAWVLNPAQLKYHLERFPSTLSHPDVQRIHSALDRIESQRKSW